MSRRHTSSLLIACTLLAAFALGCGKKDQGEPAAKTYTTRGVIESLPSKPGGAVQIHHEAIPGFVNAMGDEATMNAMIMGFAPGEVSLDGLAKGDKVELTFHTDWDAKPALRIDSIAKLPPDTELEL